MILALALSMVAVAAPPRLHLAIDLPVTLAAAGGWIALDRAAPSLARTSCPCARPDAPSFDRLAIDAGFDHGADLANVTLAVGLVGEGLALTLAAPDLPRATEDLGLLGEAVAVTGLVTEVAKIAFSRPYPYMLRGDAAPAQERDGVNYASMWSGHTAVLMAAAVATARILDLRHAPHALRIAMWIAGPVLALAAGALEVSQANHYPSDVLVAGAIGAAMGWGTVAIHAW